MSTYQHFYHEKETYGLNLNFCGSETCSQGHSFGPAVRSIYLFHYITKGSGTYTVADKDYTLTKGQGFMIMPGDSTIYTADQRDPWAYKWFAFGGDDAESIVKRCGFGISNHIYTSSDHKLFSSILDEMIEMTYHQDTHYMQQLSRVYQLLGMIASETEVVEIKQTDYIDSAMEFIHNNYSNNIHITDIARAIGLERSYLYRLFMKETGFSPRDYLLRYRLKAARQMLNNENLSITEIAYSCGFNSSSAFYKQFKKMYQTTPKQYRTPD